MFQRLVRKWYWLPGKIRGRLSRLFLPKGLDFRDETDLGFDSKTGYRLVATDPLTFRYVMRRFMKRFRPKNEVRFLDVGSGKGLLLFEAKKLGFPKIGGIELAGNCHAIALENRKRLGADDIECLNINATEAEEELDGYNTFFLGNPFPKPVMDGFLRAVIRSAERKPRELMFLYYIPTAKESFEEAGFEKLDEMTISSAYHTDLEFPVLVYRYPPKSGV